MYAEELKVYMEHSNIRIVNPALEFWGDTKKDTLWRRCYEMAYRAQEVWREGNIKKNFEEIWQDNSNWIYTAQHRA